VPVFCLPAELATTGVFDQAKLEESTGRVCKALLSHRRVVLAIGLPLVRESSVARSLSLQLVLLAQTVLRHSEIGHIYIEGGATAVELVRRMGWERLRVLEQLAPGVATLIPQGSQAPCLTVKPGSYAWPGESNP
jgi:uncharacterized protein YgbK (DUF1537 family)